MNENEPLIVVTEADLKKLAPKAKREYLTAILGGLSQLRAAGVLENEHRWCHFIAQCAHETGGFTTIRESLTYSSAARLRVVWPARFRAKTDAELAHLVNNPVALGDAVYGGRMGNSAPGDGYAFRGGGFLQTTGKAALAEYAGCCGLDPTPPLLDDCNVTLQFACLEWQKSGCNALADANDILGVSKTINVGSAGSGVTPVGMDSRKAWFAKAWGIWGDKGKPDTMPAPGVSTRDLVGKWLPIGGAGAVGANEVVGVIKQGVPAVPEVATKSLEHIGAWKRIGTGVMDVGREAVGVVAMTGKLWPYVVGAGCGAVVLAVAWSKKVSSSTG